MVSTSKRVTEEKRKLDTRTKGKDYKMGILRGLTMASKISTWNKNVMVVRTEIVNSSNKCNSNSNK